MPFRVIIGFCLSIALCNSVLAQQNKIDSLESLIKSLPSDTTRVWLLNTLVTSLREKDNNKALLYAEQAKNLAELLSYEKGLSIALENFGWVLYRRGDYTKSFDVTVQALKVYEQLKDRAGMARCLISVAAINYEQKQYNESIANFRKAFRLGELLNDRKTMARCLNNLAYGYVELHKTDSAMHYAEQALLISQQINEDYLTAFAKRTIGDVFLLRRDYEKALENFQACWNLSVKRDNTFLKVSTLHRMGNLNYQTGNYQQALDYLYQNLALAKKFGYKDELEQTYKLITETYKAKKDIPKALAFQTIYLSLHDSLADQRQSDRIALMQTRFNSEMNEAKIELLTKEAQLKEEEIIGQKVWLYFYVGCLSLFIVVVFVLLYINRYTSQAKKELEVRNQSIDSQAQQLQNLNATKDKLFSIISHDLRSPLAGLKALMELVGTPGLNHDEFVKITKVLKRNLDTVHEDLDNLLMWAQTQLQGLQALPEAVKLRGAADEKIALLRELANSKKISIINEIPDDTLVYADRNHLSLIFRNLIGNAIKFNETGGVIQLAAKNMGDYFEVSVTDSGVGISQDDIRKLFNAETHFTKPGTNKEKGLGIGLLLSKEFIENNKGSIWVTSEPGKGTTFTFTLKSNPMGVLI
jgi:two-component system sensor histidine kinase/response regulator